MSKEPSTLPLEHHLKALKLPTVLRDYQSVAAVCGQERQGYSQYLLRLKERELLDQERRAMERRLKEAYFLMIKTIESFDFAAQPSVNEPLVRELLSGDYIAKKKNVLLVGNPGTGKTHLATCLGYAACAQGQRAVLHRHRIGDPAVGATRKQVLQRFLRQPERNRLFNLDEMG
jgi:DNA replication protein DnaC